ncbi:MAG TPA: hypothetical protein VFU28_01900 [Vicinamibacterales bacterium]|nr:hypothetical protein [Vicinamibacterales bacterium]
MNDAMFDKATEPGFDPAAFLLKRCIKDLVATDFIGAAAETTKTAETPAA